MTTATSPIRAARPPKSSTNCSSTTSAPSRTSPTSGPLPKSRLVTGALADIFDALVSTLQDTRSEPDLEDLLWGQEDVFQRRFANL